MMKIKNGATGSTSDFWYDLSTGGYIKPADYLESAEDVKRVEDAITTILDFQRSLECQIEDFYL